MLERQKDRLPNDEAKAGLVSAIVATRNRPDYLRRVLACLRKQTYARIEIIVVDDGSSDDVHDIAKQYAVDTFLSTNHLGPARAFNEGFLGSRGEFVIFCDDDLELETSMIEKLVGALVRSPSKAYAYCGFLLVKENRQHIVGMSEFDSQNLIRANYVSGTSLIRRSRFAEAGMFDTSLRRLIDWDLWLSLLERGEEGVLVPEILFKHMTVQGPRISDDRNRESLPYDAARMLVLQKHPLLLRRLGTHRRWILGSWNRIWGLWNRMPELMKLPIRKYRLYQLSRRYRLKLPITSSLIVGEG